MQPFLLPDCSLQVHIALLSFEASLNIPSASNWNVQPLWKKGEETSNQHVQPVTPPKKNREQTIKHNACFTCTKKQKQMGECVLVGSFLRGAGVCAV